MKEKLVKQFNLRFLRKTNWNEIYENDTHVFIFNVTTKIVKIKPRA